MIWKLKSLTFGQTQQAIRRERGVLAQREYRRRHASKFHALQDENDRLKAAILDVRDSLHKKTNHRGLLAAAIDRASEVAGLPVREPEKATAAILSLPAVTSQPDTPDDAFLTSKDLLLGNLSLSPNADISNGMTSAGEESQPKSDYPANNTFAACIFWRALNYKIPVFEYGDRPDRLEITRNAAEIDLFMSQWVHDDGHDAIDRLWQRRLKYKRANNRVSFMASRYNMEGASEADILGRARLEYHDLEEKNFWRTSSDVESVLVSTLTKGEWARFQEVIDGSGRRKDVELLLELVESMAQAYFCMGKGPRWNCVWTHLSIGAWVKKLRTSGDDVEMLC